MRDSRVRWLRLVSQNPGQTAGELAKVAGVEHSAAAAALRMAIKDGSLVRRKDNRGMWRYYPVVIGGKDKS